MSGFGAASRCTAADSGLMRRRVRGASHGVRSRVAADAVTSAYINDLAGSHVRPVVQAGPQAPVRLLARRHGGEATGGTHARMPRPGRALAGLEA